MSNAVIVNFAAGETSPKSRGRFDTPWYQASARKLFNFVAEITGPARFRAGFRSSAITRGGSLARLIPFQVSLSRSFMLEFTNLKMRAYRNGVLVRTNVTTVTNITQASPAVVTLADATSLVNGQEIIITGLVGMIELNGRQVRLANKSGSTFELTDPVTDNDIGSSGFGAYSSGGTVFRVEEIDTPYLEADLKNLNWASKDGVMYLVNLEYAPRKLTVDSADSFTLVTFARTIDPFSASSPALTMDGPGMVFSSPKTSVFFEAGSDVVEGAVYSFAGVVGTVELNGNNFRLRDVQAGFVPGGGGVIFVSATLKDPDSGVDIDGSAFGAYVSGGTATIVPDNPIAVTFYEARLFYLGTDQRPATIFGSRSPDSAGLTRYDDFTGGTNNDDAVFFTPASTGGQTNDVAWGQGTAKFLFIGTFSGPFRVGGGGVDIPITQGSVNARRFGDFGCEATPVAGAANLFFIQRGGRALRLARFSDIRDEFENPDMLLNAEQIGESPLQRIILQVGRPDVIWAIRADGILAGMSTLGEENVTGWHRHQVGGTDGKVKDVQPFQRTDRNDQLWTVVARTINGVTQHTVELQADDPEFPDFEDFFTDATTRDADLALFENVLYRRQEEYIHVDAAGTLNGSDRGVDAAATVTPGAITGSGIAFTASVAVFVVADVGNEIWFKPNRVTGIGAGRAEITAFVSSTEVTCKILVDFDNTNAIVSGAWHFAVKTITGLWHLEGERVAVVADGAVVSDGKTGEYPVITVASGKIILANNAAVVHIGLPYSGFLETQNLEMGGQSGPAQSKPRNIVEMFIRFLNTLGARYGTDLYKLQKINHRAARFVSDRPSPVFSGIRKLLNADTWGAEEEKRVIVAQELPLPCVVQFIDMRFDIGDEG